ncbi:formylglycine-generating enzyme family protein [Poritiphilus flavus]|uniref:SUMF1/EgtB/PvdO family nonheme iron enzyme n=1 Tax=Poritiphilus flavus TaxID=2697053 RepID=A0A6L9ED09_9FLAO|nr:SUMF1/EgtB/PvdO family nonheme iron enzyme [Poritiphilus flavus]NAS12522.1 SUMF1/EgtB/PvdO family nonheme iron enzyme [Poritiphilus flavus]
MRIKNNLFLLPLLIWIGVPVFQTENPGPSPEAAFKGETNFEPYFQDIPGSEERIAMVPVTGGTFLMGSENGEKAESPVHEVALSDFWMATYEVSWEQYELFSERRIDHLGSTPDGSEITIEIDAVAAATTPYVDMSHGMGRKGYPVVNVTQHAALTFCKWLSAKTGKFYRLPTEAEWEYACRAGSNSDYFFGDSQGKLGDYAWYKENSGEKYQKIGQKKPNAFGLYDMHGNVAEWTMDAYAEDTYTSRDGNMTKDPWAVPTELYPRSVRGGSWMDDARALRSSARSGSKAAWKRIDPQIPKSRWWFTNAPHVGFRIVRPKITPPKEEIEKYWLEAIDDY